MPLRLLARRPNLDIQAPRGAADQAFSRTAGAQLVGGNHVRVLRDAAENYPAWEDATHRKTHAEHLFDVLDAWAARHTVEELHEGAQLRRIPYAAIRAPEALLADPHLAARGFFVPIEHPDLGVTVPFPGGPARIGQTPWRTTRPPRLGEHRDAVAREWLAS